MKIKKYLMNFANHAEYQTYINSSGKLLPNVSFCDEQRDVHYNPWVETRLVATFNVTSTSNATNIMGGSYAPSQFSEIEIDGVVQPSIVTSYTFDTTGEHTVKYTLSNPSEIGASTFSNCLNITSVTIPNSVSSIGTAAFEGCSGLTSIIIPNGITSIGTYVLEGCNSITSITVDDNNTTYDSRDNCNAIIHTSTNTLIAGCQNTIIPNTVTSIEDGAFRDIDTLTSITIPNSVTSIGQYAFSGCSLTGTLVIPNTVTSIGDGAFRYCTSLTDVTIPSGIASIGRDAFYGCSNLTSVIIGDTITSIGIQAFYICLKLVSVTVEATTPPTVGNYAFSSNKSERKIYVPSASVEAYKAASGWSTYASRIQAIP